MQINTIEQKILSTVQSLPMERQKEVLNFSLFLKGRMQFNKQNEMINQKLQYDL